MTCDTVVIFFSKDRAMQLDAAIRSYRAHCKDLSEVKKVVIYKASSKMSANQYDQLQYENNDFTFIEEQRVMQQILLIAAPFKFISFHCDDNMYIRDFSFAKATKILLHHKDLLGHSFRLGENVTYSYTRNSPELQPEFFNIGQKALCFNWASMQPRGFGYPLEVSGSVYRCDQILPLLLKHKDQNCAVGNIENCLMAYRNKFLNSHPFFTCNELPSVINVPVNRVGVVANKAGQKYSYSIEDLAEKFSEGFRINVSQFNDYVCNVTHVELKFSFEKDKNERVE